MTNKYQLTGMTCGSCETKVKSALMTIEDVIAVEVSKYDNSATITMNNNIALSDLQKVLGNIYQISVINHNEIEDALMIAISAIMLFSS
ncbi:heavy-metal-associated domain-containing protein [Flavobacterium sp. RSB2_4_14]|uniref:heavy-metal-associated domain-containing protein n=1 Tax=Flavobacterium sp. RSB2_4_14 TaxID=3447665 RepID=UPI003F308822